MSENILQEAERIITQDRNEWYDHPLDNFTRIAKMWSAILNTEIHWSMVPLMMEATKISRESFRPKRDNRVDGAGYWGAMQMAYDEEERRKTADQPQWEQLELPFE